MQPSAQIHTCDAEDIFEMLIIHSQELKLEECSTSKAKGVE
jgi:hypothetical protein